MPGRAGFRINDVNRACAADCCDGAVRAEDNRGRIVSIGADLREGLAVLEEIVERGYLPTLAVILASVVYEAGRIDEVRIYNRVLSAAEVQTDMNTSVKR